MDPSLNPLSVKLWGDYACFTRPDMKVERVSYPVMTPSAARGALEAIFWKPEVSWRIEEIHVLNPIRYASILRNEINDRQSHRAARRWAKSGGGYAASANRAQRHTLALRDVAYVVHAQQVLTKVSTTTSRSTGTSSVDGSPEDDASRRRISDAASSAPRSANQGPGTCPLIAVRA